MLSVENIDDVQKQVTPNIPGLKQLLELPPVSLHAPYLKVSKANRMLRQRDCPAIVLSGAAAGDAEALGSALASADAAGCPQADPEAAKAVYTALQRVVLCGALGPLDSYINGSYIRTNEKVNGKPVFVMEGDPMKCLFMGRDRKWYAALVTSKDANELRGWAHTEADLAHPSLATEWVVSCNLRATRSELDFELSDICSDDYE